MSAALERSPAQRRWDAAIGLVGALFLIVYAYRPIDSPWLAPVLTWPRVLLVCGLLVIVRHLRHPRPTLLRVLATGIQRRLLPDGTTRVLTIAVASRTAVIAAGLAATLIQGAPPHDAPRLTTDPFWNLPARWDALWYLQIAEHGYRWDPSESDQEWNVAFFPAFPVLMRVAGHVVTMPGYWLGDASILGGTAETRLIFGGWLLSMIAFTWGLANVYVLARDDLGHVRALWAVLLLAYFPFALFYSAPYSEGVFFLALTSAFLAARERRFVSAFAWGALTALTRQTGVTVALPLAMLALAWQPSVHSPGRYSLSWRGWRLDLRMLLAAAGPAAGLGLHLLVLWWQVGDPFAWIKAQQGWWHSDSVMPFYAERVNWVRQAGFAGFFEALPGPAIGTFIPVFALVLLWPVWRLSPAYAALVLVTLAPAVAIDTPSIGRIAAPLFPLFMALAAILPGRIDVWVVAALFGFGQLWAACVFFEWGMLY
jgi:hypothetical protein